MRIFGKTATFIIIFLLLVPAACRKVDDRTIEAVTAADAWLKLVDNGEYGKSWDESAKYFRAAVTKAQWKQQLSAARKPLGKLLGRELQSVKAVSSIPGGPDGEYVVIQYQTTFENKTSSTETVTPMKEKTGEWKVSGYYIK